MKNVAKSLAGQRSIWILIFLISEINLLTASALQDSLYIEAEAGTVEAPMQVFDDSTASGGQYVTVQAGKESTGNPPATGKISINVDLKAGSYIIWCRVITPSETADSFWVQVDDGTPYRWNGIGEFRKWTWAAVHDSDNNAQQVKWELEEGIHTINIYYREEGARIDEIYITRYGDTPVKGNQIIKRKIYVSQSLGDDSNEGLTENEPIRTLFRAYQIAQETSLEVTDYEILLRGGETYDDFEPIYGLDEGRGPVYFGFVWNLNRTLILSTYGSEEKAHLVGGKHKYEGGPTQGLLVVGPSSQDVLIENLFFEKWQEGALMTFETEDVHIRNIKINKIGTYFFPGEQTPRSSDAYPYTAGVIYPKNSTRILMEHIEMTNCHNVFEDVTNLHGFYGTRLNESEIRNCYLRNVSGSPFKFRRSPANNVYIHDNEAYYTGHTEFEESWAQPGFLRYSGDPGGDCPFAIRFENNIFHFPFCWSEYGENCEESAAILCSVSNTTSCGEDACTDPANVEWINNDIIYEWQPGSTEVEPTAPFDLKAESKSEFSITMSWLDINVNEDAFVVERLKEGFFEEVARLNPNTDRFTDNNLEPDTEYTYRLKVENSIGDSPYSETISVRTESPNQAPIPVITASTLSGTPPLEVEFDAKQSSDPDGDNVLYTWLVEGRFAGNGERLFYIFENPGSYLITLSLTDGRFEVDSSVKVEVYEPLKLEEPSKKPLVFPNPSPGRFSISNLDEDCKVEILDLSGALIKSVVDAVENQYSEIKVSSGIYIIVVSQRNLEIFRDRIVVK